MIFARIIALVKNILFGNIKFQFSVIGDIGIKKINPFRTKLVRIQKFYPNQSEKKKIGVFVYKKKEKVSCSPYERAERVENSVLFLKNMRLGTR